MSRVNEHMTWYRITATPYALRYRRKALRAVAAALPDIDHAATDELVAYLITRGGGREGTGRIATATALRGYYAWMVESGYRTDNPMTGVVASHHGVWVRGRLWQLAEAHLKLCEARGMSDKTISDRRNVLHRFGRAAGIDPAVATTEQIINWLTDGGWHGWALLTYTNHLRGFYKWLVQVGHRADNPIEPLGTVKAPRDAPKPVSAAMLRELLERTAAEPGIVDWSLVVKLGAFAGLRAGEICTLQRENVTAETITIRGKGNRERVIPTHPIIWTAVEGLPPGPVLRRRDGRSGDVKWLVERQRAYFDRLGYPDMHMHRLRHTFCTTLLRDKDRGGAGANIRVVQALAGHSSLATTARYCAVDDKELRDAIGGLAA